MRALLLVCGWTFVGLATIGVLLPLVPTTPFLIVAAACFAHASPRFHRWLLGNRWFGPFLRAWEETRSIPRRAKVLAVLLILALGAVAALTVLQSTVQAIALAAVLFAVIAFILTRPTTEDVEQSR